MRTAYMAIIPLMINKMKISLLILAAVIGLAQQQSSETCTALDNLARSGDMLVKTCRKLMDCTGIHCEINIGDGIIDTEIVTFINPCIEQPQVNYTYIHENIVAANNITATNVTVLEVVTNGDTIYVTLILNKNDLGIYFKALRTTTQDITTTLFEGTFIPFQCNTPTPTTTTTTTTTDTDPSTTNCTRSGSVTVAPRSGSVTVAMFITIIAVFIIGIGIQLFL